MDYLSVLDVSGAGLTVEKHRLAVVAENLANASHVARSSNMVYQPKRVISHVVGQHPFELEQSLNANRESAVLPMIEVLTTHSEPKRVFDPSHPYADALGFVVQANIDPLAEMVTLMDAVRAYDANIKAFSASKSMIQAALRIGE